MTNNATKAVTTTTLAAGGTGFDAAAGLGVNRGRMHHAQIG